MFIKSISLENYRCHKETKIDFFPGGSKGNISIIEGGDGDGKTTIFNAIGWCLYGKETSELLGAKQQSLGIPNVSAINKGKLGRVSVDLWIEVGSPRSFDNSPASIRALRRVATRGIDIVEQEFEVQIYRQNEQPRVLRDHDAQMYIDSIAPSNLIEFYMFNGEYLSSGRNVKGENIDASIKRQFRMGSIISMERLLQYIENSYRENAERAAKKNDDSITRKIKELEDEISGDESRKESLEKEADLHRREEKKAREKMEEYREAKLKIEAKREILQELSEMQSKSKELKAKKKEAIKDYLKARINYWHLAVSKMTMSESYSKIKEEIGRGNLPPNIKKEFIEDLIQMRKCICGRDLSEGSMELEKVKAILNESEREGSKSILLEISPVLNSSLQLVESMVPHLLESLESNIKRQQEEERRLAEEIERINSKETSLTEDEKLVVQEFENAQKDSENFAALANECEIQAKKLEDKIKGARETLSKLKDQQERLAGKAKEATNLFSHAKTAKLIGEILYSLRDRISNMFIISLQEEANRMISSVTGLSHLSVSFKRIAGSISVDYKDKFLPLDGKSYISEGQSQIISIVLIAAYSSVLKNLGSGIAEVPFIIMDHPFSDLGLPRKEELLGSFASLFAGTKVIMLTPPGDFDLLPLGDSIASHYFVKNDPNEKVCKAEGPR